MGDYLLNIRKEAECGRQIVVVWVAW